MAYIKKFFIPSFVAFLFLLIATKSSPLYPINDWVDANAIFTVGKAMLEGLIVYKDIFEQKGPLLYFIHALAATISKESFIGVFLMEWIAFTVFLIFAQKFIGLYIKEKYLLLATTLAGFLILFIKNFLHGDSAEEYCVPLLGISMYYLAKILKSNSKLNVSPSVLIINGIFAGSVILIKYSMIGYWFGWMVVLLAYCIYMKQYRKTIQFSFLFLSGMVISGIPWIVYFSIHNGLHDFFNVYFYTNIKYYTSSQGLLNNLVTMTGKVVLVYFVQNPWFAVVLLFGLFKFFFSKKIESDPWVRFGLLVPFLFLYFSVYGGGVRHDYYFQIMTPFILFGIITLFIQLDRFSYFNSLKNIWLYSIISLVSLSIVMFFFHHNRYLMGTKKKVLFQYAFAEHVQAYPESTLLNYGFLDVGLYHTASKTPITYYFMKHNFDYDVYPHDVDALNYYVSEAITDFVVLRTQKGKDYKNANLEKNYFKVMEQEQFYEGKFHKYILYAKKGLAK
ncbi:hypothetical protein BUL40_08365 [Croceivirga radicis]|uniref:Glycosyltransferase RgtA/B/C/D-like domain-containing protein n=1 Tax=Croceivirga radicis TaxID=1929488 RepID=A0A1V6LSD4_9FLAO|nr:hypothetical protein [Croceivirga radicis]OQD43093.1 hypothetical protein BUL40_08365 [Croceivirga radicis]